MAKFATTITQIKQFHISKFNPKLFVCNLDVNSISKQFGDNSVHSKTKGFIHLKHGSCITIHKLANILTSEVHSLLLAHGRHRLSPRTLQLRT